MIDIVRLFNDVRKSIKLLKINSNLNENKHKSVVLTTYIFNINYMYHNSHVTMRSLKRVFTFNHYKKAC